MREQLRGRNLAHIGCFFGLVLGLGGGIVLAGLLALHDVATALVLLIWVGLAVVLAAIGYATGTAITDPSARIRDDDAASSHD